jgi:hypothetical protein
MANLQKHEIGAGCSMGDRQDRLHELCAQVTLEVDPQRLILLGSEINNILISVISEVNQINQVFDARCSTVEGRALKALVM